MSEFLTLFLLIGAFLIWLAHTVLCSSLDIMTQNLEQVGDNYISVLLNSINIINNILGLLKYQCQGIRVLEHRPMTYKLGLLYSHEY